MREEIKQRIEQIRRGEVPEGYKKTKVGVVPCEWEDALFSDLFTSTSEYTEDLDKYPLYSLTIEEGITAKTERYERSHLVKKENAYKIVRPNDFAYNPMNVRFGAVARHKGVIDVAVSGYYDIFTTRVDSDLEFMDSFLISNHMIAYYNKVSSGSLVEKQRVHFSQFMDFKLAMPSELERWKIAEILSTQDRIIELYGRKIEELERQKKAFMQKMFPQKGESVPRLRFPQFTGPWEERKFGTMFKRRTERNNGQFDNTRWISVAKMYFQEAEKVSSNNIDTRTYVMRRGDIAFEGHSNTEYKYGRFVANDIGDGVISELFPISMHIDDYDESYWKYAIQIENIMAPKLLRCIEISYTSSNKLDEKFFLKESILVPSISEQQQIGLFFRSMDNLIKVNQQKLDQEKQKKKALMQLLLSGIVRVGV